MSRKPVYIEPDLVAGGDPPIVQELTDDTRQWVPDTPHRWELDEVVHEDDEELGAYKSARRRTRYSAPSAALGSESCMGSASAPSAPTAAPVKAKAEADAEAEAEWEAEKREFVRRQKLLVAAIALPIALGGFIELLMRIGFWS